MSRQVMAFHEIDRSHFDRVGSKAVHLAELARVSGVRVPDGFCVTTDAFARIVAETPGLDDRLDRMARVPTEDREAIQVLSTEVRRIIEAALIPDDLAAAIAGALARLGQDAACAVRSSATAEDLPGASFAGQYESFLNVVGLPAVLQHIRRCWSSLFAERAVAYRRGAGIADRGVQMGVIVQRMASARVSGVLFTADPVSGNRTVVSIEATRGLSDALLTGAVNPGVYRVDAGGRIERASSPDRDVLTDSEILTLTRLGRRIESQFGCPQDIEWCLGDDDECQIVQSRPITTLFPVPARADDDRHVYLSTGHQQMMTDAMKPLGISVWQLTGMTTFHEAGGRLFVDVTRALQSSSARARLITGFRRADPLVADALQSIVDRGFIAEVSDVAPNPAPSGAAPPPLATDLAIVNELIEQSEASIAALARQIRTKSGEELLDFIAADARELKQTVFSPRSHQAIMAGMEATWALNDKLETWLGERNAADTLAQSVDGNVTSEMGLALLDVADTIRPHPEVVALLERATDDSFLEALPTIAGGREARDAVDRWLDRYGMRGVGEIDITRPRWSEHPLALVPMLLANVRSFTPGEAQRRFERGRRKASSKAEELLARLRALPDGDAKADEARALIERLRTFVGYREYPKYALVRRYGIYKTALLAEAERLAQNGVLADRDDILYLTLGELRDVVRTGAIDDRLVRRRKSDFRIHQSLVPPRVLTSDGETVAGSYRRDDLPPGALVGLAVSAGTIEGRARVVLDLATAKLEPGDILVTTFTDPSWTPLFVAIGGLVTEVGGLMTHGAVIAREYGLPAVVGVANATRLIRDGQRIRVFGREGYVELL